MVFCLSGDLSGCKGCDIVNNLFECSRCSFVCDEETVFRCHLNTAHKSNFLPCIHCRTIYNTTNNLLRHLKIFHSSVKVYRCGNEQCSFKTASNEKILSHLDLCTAGKPIKCYHCRSTFFSTESLVFHMQKNADISCYEHYPANSVVSAFRRIESRPLLLSQIPSLIKESSDVTNQTKESDKNILSLKASSKKPLYRIPVPIISLNWFPNNLDQTKSSSENVPPLQTVCASGPAHGMLVPIVSPSNGYPSELDQTKISSSGVSSSQAVCATEPARKMLISVVSSSNDSPSELDQTKISNCAVPSLQAICATEPAHKMIIPIVSSSNRSPSHLDQTTASWKGTPSLQTVCTTDSGCKMLVPIVQSSNWSPSILKPTKKYNKQVLSVATSATNQSAHISKRLPYILPKPDVPKSMDKTAITDSVNIISPSILQAVFHTKDTLKDSSNKLHVFDSQSILPVIHSTNNCTSAVNGISVLVEPFTRTPTSVTAAPLIQLKNVTGPVSTSVATASMTVPSVEQMSVRMHNADIPRKCNSDSFIFVNTDPTKRPFSSSRAYSTPGPSSLSNVCLESGVPAYIHTISTGYQWPGGTCDTTYPVSQLGISNKAGFVQVSKRLVTVGTHFVPTVMQHSISANQSISSGMGHCYLEGKPSFTSANTSPFCAPLVAPLSSSSCHELEKAVKCNPNGKVNLSCEPSLKIVDGPLYRSLSDMSEVPLLEVASKINKTSSISDQYCKETLGSCVSAPSSFETATSVGHSCNTDSAEPKGGKSCLHKSDASYIDNVVTKSGSELSAKSEAFDCAKGIDSFHINQMIFDKKNYANMKCNDSMCKSDTSFGISEKFENYEECCEAATKSSSLHKQEETCFSTITSPCTYQGMVLSTPVVKQEPVSPRMLSSCSFALNNSDTTFADTCQSEIPVTSALNQKPVAKSPVVHCDGSSSKSGLLHYTDDVVTESSSEHSTRNDAFDQAKCKDSLHINQKLFDSKRHVNIKSTSDINSEISEKSYSRFDDCEKYHVTATRIPVLHERKDVDCFSPMPASNTYQDMASLNPVVKQEPRTSVSYSPCTLVNNDAIFPGTCQNDITVTLALNQKPVSSAINVGLSKTSLSLASSTFHCGETISLPDTFASDICQNVKPFGKQNTLPSIVSEKCSVSHKKELVSSSCCTESEQTSSFPSLSSTLATYIKAEPNSEYELQNASPACGETVVSPNYNTMKSEIELGAYNSQTASSHTNQCVTSTTWIYSNSTNMKSGFTSKPYISNFHNKEDTTAVTHNLNNMNCLSDYTLASSELSRPQTVPVNSLCSAAVTSTDRSYTSSDTSVMPYNTDFANITSLISEASVSAQISPCDLTFTTLATKPSICSSTNLFRNQPLRISKTNCHNKESENEPLLLAPVTSENSANSRVYDVDIDSDSMETFPGVEPINPVFSPSVGASSSGSSCGVPHCELNSKISPNFNVTEKTCIAYQCSGLLNDIAANAACNGKSSIREISVTPKSAVMNSQKASLMQSNLSSPVTLLHQSVSNKLPSLSVSEDCFTSPIVSLEHRVSDESNIILSESLVTSALPWTVENVVNCPNDNVMLDSATEENNSIPCADSLSTSDNDRHPFLNSTSLTVRQILEKFRWKHRSSSKSVNQAYKTTKYSKKRLSPKCETGISSSSTKATPLDKKKLRPPVSSVSTLSLFDTPKQAVAHGSEALGKRKCTKMLDVPVGTPPPKVRKVLENITHKKINNFLWHGNTENCIMSELSASGMNEHYTNRSIVDKNKAVRLMSEVLCNLSFEDICSGIDIFLVAKELLSYDETAVEIKDRVTDLLQTLKQKKTTEALKVLLHPFKLKDFFKCMEKRCSYTSSSCRNFNIHLKSHAPAFECAYCFFSFPAPVNLMCHLMQQHKRCLFQCSLCFYRAYSETHVRIHQKSFHLDDGGFILICPSVDSIPVPVFNEHWMLCQSSVAQPCRCCFSDCQFVSIALLDIVHHILYHHSGCSLYICRECKQECSHILEWLVHCRVHGIHLLHCIYCAYGAESRSEILNHMSQYHASDSLVVFVRSSRCVMIHLEHVLKAEGNMQKHAPISDCACISLGEHGTEVQIVLENIISTEKPFKVQECLYCQYSTESIFSMQEHLHSKHSQKDKLQYCFCESQFQTISEATNFLQDIFSHNFSNKKSSSTVLSHKKENCNLNVHQQKEPSPMISFKASEGVVDMQLSLSALKQSSFKGWNVRIFRSLFNRIQFKLQRKRFMCWYCKRKEKCLYKLRNHWRNCHVQTGKKFQYTITNKSRRKTVDHSCQTLFDCSSFGYSQANTQAPDYNSTLCICCDSESQTCFETCVKQNCTSFMKCGNKNCGSSASTSHLSKHCKSLKVLDTSPSRKSLKFDSDRLNFNSVCCSSCASSPSIEVPYNVKLRNHKVKCNCFVPSDCLHGCHKHELCSTNQKQCQIHSSDFKHPAILRPCRQKAKMSNSCTPPAWHSCLSNCPNRTVCTKKYKCSKANKYPTNADNVRLKIGLKKLPYYVKLPVFYLKQIVDLDPKIVLLDVNYKC